MTTTNPHLAEDLTRLRDQLLYRAFNEDGSIKDLTVAGIVWKINHCLDRDYPLQPETLQTTDIPTGVEKSTKIHNRLKRKIVERDQKILGLKKRIAALETAIATQAVTLEKLPYKIERAVQHALCNVRMIPVLGIGSDNKIVEVHAINDTLKERRLQQKEQTP